MGGFGAAQGGHVDPVNSHILKGPGPVYNVTLGVTGNLLFASGTVCASANVCKSAHGASVLPHLAKFESRRFWQFCRAPSDRPLVRKGEFVEVYVQGPTHVAKYEARKT